MSLPGSFLMSLLSILKRFHMAWYIFSVISFKYVLSQVLGRVKVSKITKRSFNKNFERYYKTLTLKNIYERRLLKRWHWYSSNEILKFYHRDIMGISQFSFSWFFTRILLLHDRLFYLEMYKSTHHLRNKCYKYCWCMPNGHSTSKDVNSTSILRGYVEDQVLTNFHVISTYFFDVISLTEKSSSFPRTFFDVISMVEKSKLFPNIFFDVISMVEKFALFQRTFFRCNFDGRKIHLASPSKHSSWWRRLEDVFKTSWSRRICSP